MGFRLVSVIETNYLTKCVARFGFTNLAALSNGLGFWGKGFGFQGLGFFKA